MDKEEVLRDCYNYGDTVTFFFVFYETLRNAGLTVEVERDFHGPKGIKRNPDFAVLEARRILDVLDHKASLPNPELAQSGLTRLHEKYRVLIHDGHKSRPQVTVLYPESKQAILDAVKGRIPKELTCVSFDQTSSDSEIRFHRQGEVRTKQLETLLDGHPFAFDPAKVRSTYKFIRSDPPVVYTASDLWRTFPTFRDVKTADREQFAVDRNQLLDRMLVFYPPWIRNNSQLNAGRVDAALAFLSTIKFVKWEPGGGRIQVDPSKGRRSGNILEYFADRFAKLHTKRRRKTLPVRHGKQTQLESFG